MAVRYVGIDGEQVSVEWFAVLSAMRHAGVAFRVNEGHRTMARQAYFWNLYRSGRGNLAASPSPTAPHIRTGRIDHAIDFSNASGVILWMHVHGLPSARLTVPGESWHVEASADELRAFAARHAAEPVIRRGSKGQAVQTLQVLLRRAGELPAGWHAHTKYTLTVRRAVRRFQHKHGLKSDGVVGAQTWHALRRAAT